MEYQYLSTLLAPSSGALSYLRRKNWLTALGLPSNDRSTNADLEIAYYRQELALPTSQLSLEDLEYLFYQAASATPTARNSVEDFRREYYAART
jgi:hypothetical protein